jgi:GxxExxY protein
MGRCCKKASCGGEEKKHEKKDLTQRRRGAELEMKEINDISGIVVDCAYHLHKNLGPGLLESVYEAVLEKMLQDKGLIVERQQRVPIVFEGMTFEEGFRADLIVEKMVVVELKSVETLAPVHGKQLLTYLRLLNYRLGLLINFGAPVIKDGIVRVVNNL